MKTALLYQKSTSRFPGCWVTPPKFNIAPENWWLEDYSPIAKVTFQGLCVKLREGTHGKPCTRDSPASGQGSAHVSRASFVPRISRGLEEKVWNCSHVSPALQVIYMFVPILIPNMNFQQLGGIWFCSDQIITIDAWKKYHNHQGNHEIHYQPYQLVGWHQQLQLGDESWTMRFGNPGILSVRFQFWVELCIYIYMGVSKNNGTPKSSILIGFSIIKFIHFGVPLFLQTPI